MVVLTANPMSNSIHSVVINNIGILTLDRPKALNSLSLEMVREITKTFLIWRDRRDVHSIVIRSDSEKAFCAGGDIRFFYDAGRATPLHGSASIEDFFSEEYALNFLIYNYPKPYVAFMDGIVMGGGMGLAQSGPHSRLRIVTERTKMAMPEVNIGLFPDVGGSFFLSRCPGQIGTYLGVTGDTITATDAIYANLADVFIPSKDLPALLSLITTKTTDDIRETVAKFVATLDGRIAANIGKLDELRPMIDKHFSYDTVPKIIASLASSKNPDCEKILNMINIRSPLMACVALQEIRRGIKMDLADCLRMERTMIRHAFEHGEVLEGIRAMVIDKDNTPRWNPASLSEVTTEMVEAFFHPIWPEYAHPLKTLC